MKRRHFILGPGGTLPSVCHAQVPAGAWTVVLTIVIVSAENDARLPLVHEAVDFWNRSFAKLGSAFRLGKVTQTTGAPPVDELKARSATAVSPASPESTPPESIRSVPGNIVVALSEGDFISFGARWPSIKKALVAIKTDRTWPMTLPNAVDNDFSRPPDSTAPACVSANDLFAREEEESLFLGRPGSLSGCGPIRVFVVGRGTDQALTERRFFPL